MNTQEIKEDLETCARIVEENCYYDKNKASEEELEVYRKYEKPIVVPEIEKDEIGYPDITYSPTGEKTVVWERVVSIPLCAIMDIEYFLLFGEDALVKWQLTPENRDKSLPELLYRLIEYNKREQLRLLYINRGGTLGLPDWDITNPWIDFENFINYIEKEYLVGSDFSDEELNKWDWIYTIKDDWKDILSNRFDIDIESWKPFHDPLSPYHLEFLEQGY